MTKIARRCLRCGEELHSMAAQQYPDCLSCWAKDQAKREEQLFFSIQRIWATLFGFFIVSLVWRLL